MELLDLIKRKIEHGAEVLDVAEDYLPAIAAALARYSVHRPRVTAEDLPGTGSRDLDLPAGWVEEFSGIQALEYPIGEIPASLIDSDDWLIYRAPEGMKLRLIDYAPAVGESVRATYTAPRTEDQVPAADLDAVATLAAALCCEILATRYAHESEPTLGADAVAHQSKSRDFAARAKRLRQLYNDHLGIAEGGAAPAASVTAKSPGRRRGRLTHR